MLQEQSACEVCSIKCTDSQGDFTVLISAAIRCTNTLVTQNKSINWKKKGNEHKVTCEGSEAPRHYHKNTSLHDHAEDCAWQEANPF